MAEKKRKVLLKRSSVPGKMPSQMTGSTAEVGELFLNNASGDADNFLTTLRAEGNSAVTNDYIKWSDDVANEKKFATKEEVMDNELVVSTIITKINESVGLDENSDSVLPNGDSLCDAIIELQSRTSIISATTSVISATTASELKSLIEDIEDNELVTATALSQINASAGFNEDGTSALPNGESLSDAIVTLQNKEPMVSITYSELKTLRDEGKLIPGMKYRITDYVTTTSQENTSSAGHQFDVIVTALDNKTLSEEASACLHDGDTYFTSANAKLEAWKIWYCLDNDTDRFTWADTENGKGVIYRMIDEGRNDLPYDFKNIMFRRYKLNAPESVDFDSFYAKMSENIRAQFSTDCLSYIWGGLTDEDRSWDGYRRMLCSTRTGEYMDFYTFSYVAQNGVASDISLDVTVCYDNVMDITRCHDNVIGRTSVLNNNVFFCTINQTKICLNSFGNECNDNTFVNDCFENSFGAHCYANSFGEGCVKNSFGNEFYYNYFGDGCCKNSFGDNCYSNSFGIFCEENSFGTYCYSISFGVSCRENSFGSHCQSILFGDYCRLNSFGHSCSDISFGEGCTNNSLDESCIIFSFGDNCSDNSFGHYCSRNSFGNYCSSNSFGNLCEQINFGESSSVLNDYYFNNSFGDNCCYINLVSSGSPSFGNKLQNYKIVQGLQGDYDTPITIIAERNRGYETKVAKNSAGEIKIYCEADLIA